MLPALLEEVAYKKSRDAIEDCGGMFEMSIVAHPLIWCDIRQWFLNRRVYPEYMFGGKFGKRKFLVGI